MENRMIATEPKPVRLLDHVGRPYRQREAPPPLPNADLSDLDRWYPDFSKYPAPDWKKIWQLLDWVYGFCTPQPWTGPGMLRAYPRWIHEPHARESPYRVTELGNILCCGMTWMRMVESDVERIQCPSIFLGNRPTTEARPLRDVNGHVCQPEN